MLETEMIMIATLTQFYGWLAVIHSTLLSLSAVAITLGGEAATKIRQRLFRSDEQCLKPTYLRYLSQLKILRTVFSIVPYLAMKMMG